MQEEEECGEDNVGHRVADDHPPAPAVEAASTLEGYVRVDPAQQLFDSAHGQPFLCLVRWDCTFPNCTLLMIGS